MAHPDLEDLGASPHAKWLVALLYTGSQWQRYNAPVSGRTRLMKELFLLRMNYKVDEDFYDFEAGNYGPTSNTVLRDLERLQDEGFVSHDPESYGGTYQLTPDGCDLGQELWRDLTDEQQDALLDVKDRFNRMPLTKLLGFVYRSYPEYTTESLIRDEVLEGKK